MDMLKKGDLTDNQIAHSTSIFIYFALTLLLILVFIHSLIASLYQDGYATGLSCVALAIILVITLGFCFALKLPMRCFGFVRTPRKNIIESIVISLLFCFIALIAKALLIHNVSSFSSYPMFLIVDPQPYYTTHELLFYLLLYCIFAPVQCFVYHGVFQGPLTDLTQTRAKGWLTVIYTTLFFTSVHTIFGMSFALLVALPGLVWCWIYYRHRSLLSISISHIIIGGVLLCICGVAPFIKLINDALAIIS